MAVAALPDVRRALSASADKTLKLWNLETGNPLAAFTADSDLFAVAVVRTITSLLARTMARSIFSALDVTSRCAPGGA
jgi:WD40 repeat protein